MVKNGNRKEYHGQMVKRYWPNQPTMARAASRDVCEGMRPEDLIHAESNSHV